MGLYCFFFPFIKPVGRSGRKVAIFFTCFTNEETEARDCLTPVVKYGKDLARWLASKLSMNCLVLPGLEGKVRVGREVGVRG